MSEDIDKRIQQLELDTVKAITEMRGDLKVLTKEVKRLNDTVVRMTENYVTKEDHKADIDSLALQLKLARDSGRVRTVLVGILTSVITAVITYEVIKSIG